MATTEASDSAFRPALIIVDLQNGFCPPNGSLAVPGGRELEPLILSLARLPGFVLRIATQDYHPPNHISFATNHEPPDNKPFESWIDMPNWLPGKENETVKQRLWPVHCVQGTLGAEIISSEVLENVDIVVRKGMYPQTEMYSVFGDAFGHSGEECVRAGGVSHDCVSLLKEKGVTHVFVVGLAGDYCVKETALDAKRKGGFETVVVSEGTRCVGGEEGWRQTCRELEEGGVSVVSVDGEEVARVRALSNES